MNSGTKVKGVAIYTWSTIFGFGWGHWRGPALNLCTFLVGMVFLVCYSHCRRLIGDLYLRLTTDQLPPIRQKTSPSTKDSDRKYTKNNKFGELIIKLTGLT